MSDFLKGVGIGLAGNGVARAVQNVALAPYLAAIKQRQAMTDAALADLRGTQAALERGKLNVFNGILDGTVDPTRATQARYAISGKPAYGNGNVPGVPINYQTGEMPVGNQLAYKAYLDEVWAKQKKLQALAESAKASAANSYSSAARHKAETGLIPYKKQKLEAETRYTSDRTKNPQRYSRNGVHEYMTEGEFVPSPAQQKALKDYLSGKISRQQLEETK